MGKTEKGRLDKDDFRDLLEKKYTFSSENSATELSSLTFKRKFDVEYFNKVWSDILQFGASQNTLTLSLRAAPRTGPTTFRAPIFSDVNLPLQIDPNLRALLFPRANKDSQVLAIADQEPETKES